MATPPQRHVAMEHRRDRTSGEAVASLLLTSGQAGRHRGLGVLLRFCVCLLCAVACNGYSHTSRVVDGKIYEGRPIPSVAYAAALRAAYLEARGQYAAALLAYRKALGYDEESVELQTQIAKLTCRAGSSTADDEFSEAVNLDPYYEPAWREWARCALRHNQGRQALRFAQMAQAVAPLEFSSTDVLVAALEANGENDLAHKQLIAYLNMAPRDLRAWQRLLDFAEKHSLEAWVRAAGDAVERLEPKERVPLVGKPLDPDAVESREALQTITHALNRGSLKRAQELAVEFRLSATELALLAAEQGYFAAALRQAQLVLAADPRNSDARIAALVAAHQLSDFDEFRELLELGPTRPTPPSRRSAQLFERLLEQTDGSESAALWAARSGILQDL